jgi:hypothetical protein
MLVLINKKCILDTAERLKHSTIFKMTLFCDFYFFSAALFNLIFVLNKDALFQGIFTEGEGTIQLASIY